MAKSKNRRRLQTDPSGTPSSRRNVAIRQSRKFLCLPEFLESRALMAITSPTGGFILNAVEGQTMTQQTVATFKVDDGVTNPANFSATVDWGNGDITPAQSITFNATNSTYTVAAFEPNKYSEDKTFPVQVMLTEYTNSGKTVVVGAQPTVNDTANVADAALNAGPIVSLTATEGQSLGTALNPVQVASFTDTDPGGKLGEYQVLSVNWGDGTSDTNGTVTQGPNNTFIVSDFHTYAEQGNYVTSVVVKDVESINSNPPASGTRSQVTITPAAVGNPPVQPSNVTVSDASLNAGTPVVFAATEGTAASGVVANFTDSDPGGTASDYLATVNWGDGSPLDSTTTITPDGKGGFNVTGGHLYKDDTGVGPIVVTVYDVSPNGNPVGNITPRLITDPTDAKVVINSSANLSASPIAVTGVNFNTVEQTAAPVATSFSPTDSATQGNWIGVYGSDGYWIPNDGMALPAYASGTTATGANPYTWNPSTTDVRALQLSSNPSSRAASTWFNGTSESFTVPITDGKTHEVSLYLLDWDTTARSETVQLLDVANNVISTQTVSNFHNGVYLNFLMSGTETLKVINTGPSNAVASGLFFGSPNPTGVANFINTDTATIGNWIGAYGADGYSIPNDATNLPAYATVTPAGANPYTWVANTPDPRALQLSTNPSVRAASTWYNGSTESFDVKITDGKAHAVSLYLLDWDTSSRSERVDIVDDATGTVLNTQNVVGFHGGEYLTWQLQGNVTIKVTNTGPTNAVVSGIFFGGAVGPVIATFTDANPYKPITDFSGTVNWGDGSPVQSFTSSSITQPGGFGTAYQVKLPHFYAEEGTYQPLVTIFDEGAGGSNNSASLGTATVADGPLTGNAVTLADANGNAPVEGINGKYLAATFFDSDVLPYNTGDVADYKASIDWGDGNPVDTTSYQILKDTVVPGRFLVYGTHTYGEEGTYSQVKVVITDTDAGEPSATFTPRASTGVVSNAIVNNAPINVAPTANPTVSEGQPLTNVAIATLTDSGGLEAGTPAEYTVTVNWGDGTPSAADSNGPGGTIQLVLDPTTKAFYTITGSHTYTKKGTYPISVSVVDDFNTPFPASSSTTNTANVTSGTLTVNPGGFPIVGAVEGTSAKNLVVGTFTYNDPFASASDFQATVNWNDTTGVVNDPNTSIALVGSQYQVTYTGTHAIPEQGTVTPTINITSASHGVSNSANSTAKVADAALSKGTPLVITGTENNALNNVVIGTFTDADGSSPSSATDYTVTVNWGDPTGVNNIQTLPASALSGSNALWTIKGSHTYAEEGSYAVTVSVVDNSTNIDGSTRTPTDPTDSTVTLNNTANIGDLAVTVIPQTVTTVSTANPNPVEGQTTSFYSTNPTNPTPFVLATFSDADSTETTTTSYSATVDWGDGTTTSTGPGVNIVMISPGLFQLNGFHNYAEQGSYPVKVSINDVGGASNTGTSTANVADAALKLATTNTIGATEGQTFTGQLLTFNDTDPAGTPSDYAVQINWNDGSGLDTTSGKVTQPGGVGTPFVVSGSHLFIDDQNVGITVTVKDISPNGVPAGNITPRLFTDPTDATLTTTVPGVIQPAALTITSFPPISAVEGISTGPVVVGTFTDASSVKPITDFSGTIDWGDGSPVQSFTSAAISPAGPPLTYNITLSHVYSEETGGKVAYHAPVLTVYDEFNGVTAAVTATATGSPVTVADAPLTVVSPTPGSPVSYTGVEGNATGNQLLATFTDADTTETDPTTYTATITWGDGKVTATNPGDIVYNAGTKQFQVFGNHVFAETGTYFTSVTIYDTDGGPITPSRSSVDAKSDQFSISDASLTTPVPAASFPAVEGNSATNDLGTFVDTNPNAPLSDFPSNLANISINWGDTTTTTGAVTQPGGVGTPFHVVGTHTYSEATSNNATITVTVTDVDGKQTTFTTKAAVTDAPITSIGSLTKYTVQEGALTPNQLLATFTDANPTAPLSDYTATVDWGDGTTTPGTAITISQPGGVGTAINVSASGHQYADPPVGGNPYVVKVTLKDVEGQTATSSNTQETVTDAPLTVFGQPLTIHMSASAPSTVNLGSFSDANLLAPVSDFPTANIAINWGDGTGTDTSTGSVTKVNPGLFQVKGTHGYAAGLAGSSRPVTIVVTDVEGNTVTLNATVIVDA